MRSVRVAAERDPSIREAFKESTEKPISQMKKCVQQARKKGREGKK